MLLKNLNSVKYPTSLAHRAAGRPLALQKQTITDQMLSELNSFVPK